MQKNELLITSVLLLFSLPVFAGDLGTVGKTYPIAERDSLSELEDRARRIDTKKMLAKVNPEKYRPGNLKNLPRASKARTYQVDMTYTVQEDIPDGKGGILYPRGYTFNPLDYMPFRKTLVIIDATDPQQVTWFTGSRYKSDPAVMLLLTDGAARKVQRRVRRPVFYATEPIVKRFLLSAVPSVIRAKGSRMEVEEIALPLKRSTKGA